MLSCRYQLTCFIANAISFEGRNHSSIERVSVGQQLFCKFFLVWILQSKVYRNFTNGGADK